MATIAWLVPRLIEGSGGHRTILQHADHLRAKGHRCVLYMEDETPPVGETPSEQVERLFGYSFDDVRSGWGAIEPADMVFATIWYSARVVRDLPFDTLRCYFVQDLEAMFNPMGSAYVMAENSYRYGLYPITIGRWLPAMLRERFDVAAASFDFCADSGIYRPLEGQGARQQSVCFIFQPEKPRRCAEVGIEALSIVKHFMPEVEINLYGSRDLGQVGFEHNHLGLLPLEECNRLYNRSGVGLCISTSNPSRIPFEMMAAGLPVVEVHRENNLYDLPEDAVTLCDSTPEALARGIMELLADPQRAAAMGEAGARYMSGRSLEYGLEQFRETVETLLAGEPFPASRHEPLYHRAALSGDLSAYTAETPPPEPPSTPPSIQEPVGRLGFLPAPIRTPLRAGYRALRRVLG